jgi:hypothetical protein
VTPKGKTPRELREGLLPIRVGLLREDYKEALRRAIAEREATIARKLEILRDWYGVETGPDCWRDLCLALAADRFPGFRDKAGRKPPKWTEGVLAMLAGEMRRADEEGARTQEKAAQHLAAREPWKGFLSRGQWKTNNYRERWENLLDQYTRMPKGYREVGEHAYSWHKEQHTLAEWNNQVQEFLDRPA